MASHKVRKRAERIISLFPRIMGSIARMHPSSRYGVELTFHQYQALIFIHEARKCSITGLAHMLKIAESTTSQLVERLVKAGLVHRETHLGDRRQMDLRLSTKGRKIMDQRTQSLMESYTKILSLLDDNDQQMFEDAFEKFHAIAVKLDQKLVHHGD